MEKAKVVWYEVPQIKDNIDIFKRINMDKIPLTNAELIKAYFLNSSNFSNNDADKLKQLEIAMDWDRIEFALQNDEMWYFLNNESCETLNRIELILNAVKVIFNNKEEEYFDNDIDPIFNYGNDPYSTYRFFSERFEVDAHYEIEVNELDVILQKWKEVKNTFQIIENWFTDRVLYHKVGYLIATGTDIKELLSETRHETKETLIYVLNEKISRKIKCDNLEKLKYEKGKENTLIKNILLFHNIQTMLDNKKSTHRFPFVQYKDEKWDIEHIHTVAEELPENKELRIDWLKQTIDFIKEQSLEYI